MATRALIVQGGWAGHQPKEVADVLAGALKERGVEVTVSDTLDSLADAAKLKALNLIVPIWTMGEITKEQFNPLNDAVQSGVGLGGCHGGMCDAFRKNTEWGDFMRLQITTDLERIYGAVNEVKPHVVISASPFGIHSRQPGGYQGTGTESYHHHYQDSFRWLEGGSLDLMFPMIYWPIGSAHPFEVLVADFMQHTGGRHLAPAFNRRASEEIIASIQEVRNQGGAGTAYWVYGRWDWETFDLIYPAPAPIPERTWKTHPVAGIVVGQVRSLAGAPFVDAQVRLGEEMRLSAGDGFFAFLNVPPGTHALTVDLPAHDGYPGSTLSAEVTVAAGQTVRQNLEHLGGVRP